MKSMSTGSGNKYPVFTLGTFITKGYGPKSAVDLDMFAGENQSIAYLSETDMENIGINCGDYLLINCCVEEEDDVLLDEGEERQSNPIHEHRVIALAWSHSKASKGQINFSLLLRRTFGIRNTGRQNATTFKNIKIYLENVMLKQEEAISSATSITLSLDLRNSNDRINKNTKSSKGNKKAVKIPNIFSQYIGQLIGGRLVTKGTPLSISIFGVSHRFLIVDIKNKPTVTKINNFIDGNDDNKSSNYISRILPSTRVIIRQENEKEVVKNANRSKAKEQKQSSSFQEIGGLKKEIDIIRRMIEVPLHQPELFIDLGIKPPKGVLLYGPPGTGKTMIAKAVANDINASFFSINGPELVNKYVGQSESGLRDVFNRALEEQPSIIFIDEIDAMCPRRDGRNGDDGAFNDVEELDKRMVSTLLTLMDGALTMTNAKIVVIAATNRPQAIDQALRRPGRFDKEVEIGVPNQIGRFEILKCMLREIPHQLNEEMMKNIASVTHGFVGADLKALCQEATMHAIYNNNNVMMKKTDENEEEKEEYTLTIVKENIDYALNKVKPSALRELAINVPSVRWTDIGGQKNAKQKLLEAVEWPLKYAELFTNFGINPPKGILLYGPPGCSKTMMAKAVATESSMNFIAVKGPELLSQWVGDSEKAVRDLFRKARAAAPTIVFFDEIDAMATKRGSGSDSSSKVVDRVLSQLLVELDGVDPLNQVVVLAATNRPDMLDTALLRPGRIDYLVYVKLPEIEARLEILKIHLRNTPVDTSVSIEKLSELTDGYSGAEIAALCSEAAFAALESNMNIEHVQMEHFIKAFERVKPQTSTDMIEFYEKFETDSGRS